VKKIVLLFFLVAFLAGSAFADLTARGTAGAQFLKMGNSLDAKWTALSASTSLVNDAASLLLNPAGLAKCESTQIKMTGLGSSENEYYTTAIYSQPISKYGVLAAGILYDNLSFEDIAVWDCSTNVGYAIEYKGMSIGIAGKYIHQTIATFKAQSFALDLGGKYCLPAAKRVNVMVGAAVQNIGSGVKFLVIKDPLPLTVKVGASVMWMISQIDGVVYGDDVYFFSDDNTTWRVGLEYIHLFGKITGSLRLGYAGNSQNLGNLANLSVGLGASLNGLYDVDYALVSDGDLGQSHRLTLSVKFNTFGNEKKKEGDQNEKDKIAYLSY